MQLWQTLNSELKTRFCPRCGDYVSVSESKTIYWWRLAAYRACPHCDGPLEITGLVIFGIGAMLAAGVSLILCIWAEPAAVVILALSTLLALARGLRQRRIKRVTHSTKLRTS